MYFDVSLVELGKNENSDTDGDNTVITLTSIEDIRTYIIV